MSTWEIINSGGSDVGLDNDPYRIAQTCPSVLDGEAPSSILFRAYKTGAPSGNVVSRIYSSSNVLKATSTNSIDASSLVAGNNDLTFTFSGVTLATDDYMAIEKQSGTFPTTARIDLVIGSDTVAGTKAVRYNGSWSDVGGDMYIIVTYGGVASTGTRLPPPPLVVHF